MIGERRALNFVRTAEGAVLFEDGLAMELRESEIAGHAGDSGVADGSLRAPMPGKIVAVQAAAGDAVEKGRPIVVLEAMKMEHALTAPFDGTVAELTVTVGQQVTDGTVLARVEKT